VGLVLVEHRARPARAAVFLTLVPGRLGARLLLGLGFAFAAVTLVFAFATITRFVTAVTYMAIPMGSAS